MAIHVSRKYSPRPDGGHRARVRKNFLRVPTLGVAGKRATRASAGWRDSGKNGRLCRFRGRPICGDLPTLELLGCVGFAKRGTNHIDETRDEKPSDAPDDRR
jgi:hypothetical protein